MEPRDFGWTQVAIKEMYPTPISDGVALAPDALLKVVKWAVVVKSSAGQKGVDADNPTLHVQCFVYVREATGVSMRRQGRLYRPMKMTMMK